MKILFIYFPTILKLGINNVAFILYYRFRLKFGLHKIRFKQRDFKNTEDFFAETIIEVTLSEAITKQLVSDAEKFFNGQLRYYSCHWKEIGHPPGWFLNPFNGAEYPNVQQHWTNLPDFHPEVGDIKNVWEASRFEWLHTLARSYAISGEKKYLEIINSWLKDWKAKNPVNTGPNWKCGQEASIRVFNVLNSAFVLKQWESPSDALIEFVYLHLKRISGNIRYAIAQNNNHGTSEAAALFIGGEWLQRVSVDFSREGKKFAHKGRRWLENRVKKLIAPDGSFSQHSVNYHRVMLDTLCFAEFWGSRLNSKPFSEGFYKQAKAATQWLWMLTDETSGRAPNLGANDGAMLLHSHSCSYLDLRPSLQLAGALFEKQRFFNDGPWDEALFWFSVDPKKLPKWENTRKSILLDKSYLVMVLKDSWAMLRLPYFKFRPSQNDVFHFDLWHKGKNILYDSGSYSYFPGNTTDFDFKSISAHNTASFDKREQMPSLGPFLLGNWLKSKEAGKINKDRGFYWWEGSYFDSAKNLHKRKISWAENQWILEDSVEGHFKEASFGFNLGSDKPRLEGNQVLTEWGSIEVKGAENISISQNWYSEHYWEKKPGNRLIINLKKSGTIEIKINLS